MSQIWLFPSGYVVLYDCTELGWKSSATAQKVANKIKQLTGSLHVNVAVASHLHTDHVGMANIGGFWALIEKFGVKIDKFVDRDSGVLKSGATTCSEDNVNWHNVGEITPTGLQWVCYATNKSNPKIYKIREIAKVCSTTQINPPDSGAKVTIVSADALGATLKDGVTPVAGDHHKDKHTPNENDYSVGSVLQYGSFSFGTFGDLDGVYASSAGGNIYDDIETPTMKRVGPLDVYNSDHHGSLYSNNKNWINHIHPTVAVISCGKKNTYSHPGQSTIDNLSAVNAMIYMTELGNPNVNYPGNTIVAETDIVITVPSGGKTYTVTAGGKSKTYTSKGKNQPSCSR